MSRREPVVFVLLMLLLAGCGGASPGTVRLIMPARSSTTMTAEGASSTPTPTPTPTPVLESITVTPQTSVHTGATQQFKATALFSSSSMQPITTQVTWSSSATAVATISAAGIATAVGGGITTIQASLSGVSGTTTLTVIPRIFVTDFNNNRIVRMDDISGTNFTSFGTLGIGAGNLNNPNGVALGPSGQIFVADTANNRIVRVDDMTGANFTSLGTLGTGGNNFNNPSAIFLH